MEDSIGKTFMERTKYHHMGPSDQMQGRPQPPLELAYDRSKPLIDLPDPQTIDLGHTSLREAIDNRRSVRQYAPKPLTMEELSYLLWCTQGVKGLIERRATLRTVPSAGARHALETYLLANQVEGLNPGIYRFLAIDHQLVPIDTDPGIADPIVAACLGQSFVKTDAVTFFWTAVAYRMKWRYGERGYRYLHIDAGHVCQNLYLSAEAIDCGVCAIAAFNDDQLNHLLGLDGEEQFVIYLATVGKK